MQPFHVLHILIFISLTTLIEAQNNSTSECNKTCGGLSFRYPFGIGRHCSANEWYNIDCNASTPYLSALNNLQVVGVYLLEQRVMVNLPLIVNCKNPVQDSNTFLSTSLGKSPFSVSGSDNFLAVEGCGSAAIMENGTIVSGCSTTCRNDTITDRLNCFGIGCCLAAIPHDLKSFSLTLKGTGNGTCRSAAFLVFLEKFGVAKIPIQSMVEDNPFVPISLSWNETFEHDLVGCRDTCGDIRIPYPFGIGKNCSVSKWYNVDCNYSTPYLSAFNNMELLGLNSSQRTVTVNFSIISDCHNPLLDRNLYLSNTPFRLSGRYNIFVVEGCGNAVIMERRDVVAGCSTTCSNDTVSDTNNCFGIGCCQSEIPFTLDSFTFNLTGLVGDGKCGSAFLVDRNSFVQGKISNKYVPISLMWAENFANDSVICIVCRDQGGYCLPNPDVFPGTECIFPAVTPVSRESQNGLSTIKDISITSSTTMGFIILSIVCQVCYKYVKKRSVKEKKRKCFERNGGKLLKQREESIGLVDDKTILFTSSALEKATDHFNENRILGRGGQGIVYKGMLADGRIVAIKKSIVVDESQVEQFINEVLILSQVNHRNVVKLLGCCLETDVPIVVYEFISNGTLDKVIQDETGELSLSLHMRIRIATEVAGALSYLHSATSIPIYHRDVKSTNILLDEKYRAKVSDFGTSRLVSIDQTHLTTLVKGTFGYFDPEYFQSSQFTEKSDVYSFGVVLLELMTREKPISLTRFGEHRSLATYFMVAMEEGRVMSVFDAMVVREGSRSDLLAIANLAFRCLNLNGKNRPTMKEVAIELESIRLSHAPSTIQTSFGHVKYSDEVPHLYNGSTSTSLTFDDDLCR